MNEQEQVGNSSSRTQRCSGPLSGWAESKSKATHSVRTFVRSSVRLSVVAQRQQGGRRQRRRARKTWRTVGSSSYGLSRQRRGRWLCGGATNTLRHPLLLCAQCCRRNYTTTATTITGESVALHCSSTAEQRTSSKDFLLFFEHRFL